MQQLSFSYVHPKYVSETFEGNVNVQCVFPNDGYNRVLVETRMASGLPWSNLKSVVIGKENVFSIKHSSDGQEFRLSCMSKPSSLSYEAIAPQSAGVTLDSEVIDSQDAETIGTAAAAAIVDEVFGE